MRAQDIHWHIYPKAQIKPELHGNLIYILEVPAFAGAPVLRDVFDPTGLEFPATARRRISSLFDTHYNGIVYVGLSKTAVYDVMLYDPVLLNDDTDFAFYNRQIVANARNFFLTNPNNNEVVAAEQRIAPSISKLIEPHHLAAE